MKLIYAIVSNDDAERVVQELNNAGFGATKQSSTGGFLKRGNTTIMVVTEDENLSTVAELIESVCGKRETIDINVPYMNFSGSNHNIPFSYPSVNQRVEVGGAVIFAVDVCYYNKI